MMALQLDLLEAISVACALEEAVRKLIIIEELHASSQNEASNKTNSTSIRSPTIQILRMTRDELITCGSYRCLLEYVKMQEEQHHEDATLNSSYERTLQDIQKVKKNIEEISKANKQIVQEKNKIIAEVVSEIQEELSCNEAKISLAEQWEDAREQQNLFKCQMEEAEIETKVHEAAIAIDSEYRVDMEIESYLQLATTKLKEEIEKWKKKYDEEIAEREVELASLMEERNAELEKLERLNMEFLGRQKEIGDYLSAKEDLRRSEERQQYLNKMAIKIQAWWRGTMVRRHLGPYKYFSKIVRPQKKGKGKKK